MEDLIKAINTTPIIDNHAHPLLIPSALSKYSLLAITTEAHGDAMRATPSTLSHIRAVKQLSDVLNCPATWDDVVKAINIESAKPHHVWQKRCLEGIETILVDDGLDGKDEVYDYSWHDKLTRSECKKIVRIEKVAEEIINELMQNRDLSPDDVFSGLREAFELVIKDALEDEDVVGFKSVICYRTGLNIPPILSTQEVRAAFVDQISQLKEDGVKHFKRLDDQPLNAYLVGKTAHLIARSPGPKKPFQFHTGLGDNDITLTTSSPSHLQEFIRKFPTVPIVLLHASYPWTKEAGYLAAVYDNVYADIGEVFPFLSKDGQVTVVREILELCPTQKICWSTDGHWFPETYLLAIIQVREALEIVLTEYVRDGALTVAQAVRAVEDIFFNTSNDLYDLRLTLKPFDAQSIPIRSLPATSSDLQILNSFLAKHPSTKFLRLQFVDYTSTLRLRIFPIKRVLFLLLKNTHLQTSITRACLGLLQNDTIIPGVFATGDYLLTAQFSTLQPGPSPGYASVQGEFYERDGKISSLCPRAIFRQTLEKAYAQNLEFILGFEIEIVFMSRSSTGHLTPLHDSAGHAWNSARALHSPDMKKLIEDICDALSFSGIDLETWHPESSTGQYEFVLPAKAALEAVDTLIHAREIITSIAAARGLRATLYPKPYPMMAGTANHAHISLSSPNGNDPKIWKPFYAGILKHMKSLLAFTYSNPASYERMADGCWAGGRWVGWGTENKEAALRYISDSHFEIKILDGMANIYLAMATIIAIGLKGIEDGEEMKWGDCLKDPAILDEGERKELGVTEMLPLSLEGALKELEADEVVRKVLGNEVVERYVDVKRAEMEILGAMEEKERREWVIERY